MNYLLILIIAAAAGFWAGRRTAKTFTPAGKEKLGKLRTQARKALSGRTGKRKERILEYMKKEAIHHDELRTCGIDSSRQEFNRRDVEKLLEVSEGTARKYLNELEAEEKIEQIGKTGPDVYYILKKP